MRLLIVDDNEEMRSSLKYMFERTGHKVVLASNRDEALRIASDDVSPPDAVLVDYYFAGAALGPVIAEGIRQRNKRCIIFMYSAATDSLPVPPGPEVLAHFAKDIISTEGAKVFTKDVARKVEETFAADEDRLTKIKKFDWDTDLFRYLVATLGTGLDIIAHDYRIIYCNERFLELVGLPRGWVPPSDAICWKVYHGHVSRTQPCPGCVVADVFRTGRAQQRVVANPVKGILTFFEVSGVPLFTPDGRIYAVVETISDETERMKARFLSRSFHEAGWDLDAKFREAAIRLDELGMPNAIFYLYDTASKKFYQRCPRRAQNAFTCANDCETTASAEDVAPLLGAPETVPMRYAERAGKREVLALLRIGREREPIPVGLVRASEVAENSVVELQVQLLGLIADTIGECLQYETATARAQAAEAIRDLDARCAQAKSLQDALSHLIAVLVEHVKADMGHVRMLTPLDKLERVASAGEFQSCIVPAEDPRSGDSAAARAFVNRKPYVIRHTVGDEVFAAVQLRLGRLGIPGNTIREFARSIRSYAAVPILLQVDQRLGTPVCAGTIYLSSFTCGFFTGEKIAVMEDFANRAAELVYRYRFAGQKEEAWREFSQIAAHRVGNQVSAFGELFDVLAACRA